MPKVVIFVTAEQESMNLLEELTPALEKARVTSESSSIILSSMQYLSFMKGAQLAYLLRTQHIPFPALGSTSGQSLPPAQLHEAIFGLEFEVIISVASQATNDEFSSYLQDQEDSETTYVFISPT